MPTGMRSFPIRGLRSLALGLGSLLLAALVIAPQADGYIYWANNQSQFSIGRANLDGSGVNNNFIATGRFPQAVAVTKTQIFWTSEDGVGVANLDGTGVNGSLIPPAAGGVVAAGPYVYWANTFNGAIGRANVDGTGADPTFITGAGVPLTLAIEGGHIYWANDAFTGGAIGRANRDGSEVEPNFIAANDPNGLAVTRSSIFWTSGNSSIARAGIDGSDPTTFLDATPTTGVAADRKYVYWTDLSFDSIGRVNLDGSGLMPQLASIPGDTQADGIAVDAGVATCAGKEATVVGTGRPDKLRGTPGDDVIAAQGGDDRVTGLGGDDLLCAGAGDDRVTGGGGDDELRGKGGDDRLRGGTGEDLHRGGGGDDDCRGTRSDHERGC